MYAFKDNNMKILNNNREDVTLMIWECNPKFKKQEQ